MSAKTQALLLIAPGCAHCPSQLVALSHLIEKGQLGRLDVVNVLEHPEIAAEHGSRSVPWVRIGPFELSGSHSAEELARWIDHANRGTGMAEYLTELLEAGGLRQAEETLLRQPQQLSALIDLLGSLETPMAVRIGVGAIMEGLEGTAGLRTLVPALGKLTSANEPQIRTDACHYLGLSHDPAAGPYIRPLLDDADPEVREAAEESLQLLAN